jgi:outer membrane immunogenic protein
MLRHATLIAASVLALTASAQAADMGRARGGPPPPSMIAPTPISQWNGFYVGLNGGYGWGQSSHTSTVAPGTSTGDFDTEGGLFGATVGYNYNAGSFVVGLEADLAVTWIDGSGTFTGGPLAGFAPPGTATSQLRWLDTFRARVGIPYGPWLPFLSGGAAYGNVRGIVTGPGGGYVAGDDTRLGWTIGLGAEYMFGPLWSAKLEYQYVDLGTLTVIGADDVRYRTHILRAGVNWHMPPR